MYDTRDATMRKNIESRQRLERLNLRLEKRMQTYTEEEKFQEKIKARLKDWNYMQNRLHEEQLKR